MQSDGRVLPRHRPPGALRVAVGLLAGTAVLFNVALMISDRAPGALRRLGGEFVERLSARLDAGDLARLATDPPVADPTFAGSDAVIHVAVWATAMTLCGLAVWSWRNLAAAAVVLLAGSLVVEIAQGRYTYSRAVEASDVAANAGGVLIGVTVAASCYTAWSAGAIVSRFSRVSRRDARR